MSESTENLLRAWDLGHESGLDDDDDWKAEPLQAWRGGWAPNDSPPDPPDFRELRRVWRDGYLWGLLSFLVAFFWLMAIVSLIRGGQ